MASAVKLDRRVSEPTEVNGYEVADASVDVRPTGYAPLDAYWAEMGGADAGKEPAAAAGTATPPSGTRQGLRLDTESHSLSQAIRSLSRYI